MGLFGTFVLSVNHPICSRLHLYCGRDQWARSEAEVEVPLVLRIWPRGEGQIVASAHRTTRSALVRWRRDNRRRVAVLSTDTCPVPRRPTKWEIAATPLRFFATRAAARDHADLVVAPLPSDLDSDFFAVSPVIAAGREADDEADTDDAVGPAAGAFWLSEAAAASLPKTLLDTAVESIAMAPEHLAHLKALRARTVRDVCKLTRQNLIGPDGRHDIFRVVRQGLLIAAKRAERRHRKDSLDVHAEALREARRASVLEGTLEPILRLSLGSLPEAHRDIMVRILGLDGPPESGAAVARDKGVSRERIRQIVGLALDRCERDYGWPGVMVAHFEASPLLGLPRVVFAGQEWAARLSPATVDRLYQILANRTFSRAEAQSRTASAATDGERKVEVSPSR